MISSLVEIIVDTFEADSNILEAIVAKDFGHVKMKSMDTGDIIISCKGYTIGIEMKRTDFDSSLHSGRLASQIARCTLNYNFPVLIIENWHPYISPKEDVDEDSIREMVRKHDMTVRTLNRKVATYDVRDQDETLQVIEELVRDLKTGRIGVLRRPVIVEDNVPDNVGLLCRLPFIDKVLAGRILNEFGSVENALFHHLEDLEEIEGIGKKKLARIKDVLSMGAE